VTVTDTLIAARQDDFGAVPAAVKATPVAPVFKAADDAETRVRIAVRLRKDTDQRARYWADKANISVNEYISEAVEEKIRRENGDYDLPTLEQGRLNQLIDQMASLSTNVANLESVTTSGFDALMGLTRGDNYLLDPEDGEIGADT
jgi:hypothetical protein